MNIDSSASAPAASPSAVTADIFVSYNHADEDWAREVARRIEQETIDGTPRTERLSAFFAPWDIEVGSNFVNRLNDGLRAARFFAPVISPEFFDSGWTNFEWTDQVSLDPTNASGRIIPLLLRDVSLDGRRRIEFPAPFTTLNRLDFRRGLDFEAQFAELIRLLRGLPKSREQTASIALVQPRSSQVSAAAHAYAFPDSVPELLVSNMIALSGVPPLIWSGETSARKPAEVWEKVDTSDAFVLRDKRMYTFANLTDELCPLRTVIDTSTIGNPDKTSDWSSDAVRCRNLVALLNQCVKQHGRERRIGKDEKGRFYFWPALEYPDGSDAPPIRNTRYQKFPSETKARAVAAKKTNPADNSVFWVHYAAKLRIELLDGIVFLRIEPTYIFTKDGREPLDGKSVGRLSIQWSGKQQNPDVLRAVLFWAHILSDGDPKIRIAAGSSLLTGATVPALTHTIFGIRGDYVRVAALVRDFEANLDEIAAEAQVVEREYERDENDGE